MMVLQEISYATAKKKKGMTVGFVTFQSVEQLTNAVQVIVPLYILSICLGVQARNIDFYLLNRLGP